jgi:mono/diheme cytochrome c family protein
MQAMMAASICILAWLGYQFFNSFKFQPIFNSEKEKFYCGNIDAPDTYRIVNGVDGKALFNANCASCHRKDQQSTGPALMGVEARWPDKKLLYSWIRNSDSVLKSGNEYANSLFNEYNKVRMQQFPSLTNEEIDAILSYIQ